MKNVKLIAIVALIVVLVIGGLGVYWNLTHGNRQLVDTKYHFDRAVIRLPNGEVVEGKISSWLDYADSDVVQVKINGKTYLTSYVNVCLISE
ncbi:MAG: hypothetical protein IJ719_09435 [Clostridia bacterium]|nr:hypothetical protein [Clostridia bacterium]